MRKKTKAGLSFVMTLVTISIFSLFISCSKSDGSSTSSITAWLDTYASGFALSSPTANTGGVSFMGYDSEKNEFNTSAITGAHTLKEKAQEFESVAKGTNGCHITLPSLGGFSGRANCFGPQVNYANHPDGSGGSGQLPGGDLGIWEATEGSNNTACAAAQVNALMKSASSYVDAALLLQASSICLLNQAGTNKPTSGTTVDFTTTMSSTLKTKNASATITKAEAKNVDGSIYQFYFKGTTDGAKEFEVTLRIAKTSDTDYQGRIYGYFTTTDLDAFGVTFKRSGSTLEARMLAGTWNSSTTTSSLFDSSGDLVLSGWSSNMNQAIINMDASTGVGQISYAWQAGSGDDKTRVFNAYTQDNNGTIDGCGFFGYGNSFSSTYSSNTNAISGFICNWAGPGNDHSMSTTSGKSQKQCFTKNATSGVFEEVSSKRKITYAPTVSCDDPQGGFTYDYPAHSAAGATNDLVTLSSDTEFSSYSAPSAPVLSSGL